jgi:hypothetical protein
MLHPKEMAVTEALAERFDDRLQRQVANILRLYEDKRKEYDSELPPWHRLPFGILSIVTEIMRKGERLYTRFANGCIKPDKESQLRDDLKDMILYGLFALAWLDIGGEDEEIVETGETNDQDQYGSPYTRMSDPVERPRRMGDPVILSVDHALKAG